MMRSCRAECVQFRLAIPDPAARICRLKLERAVGGKCQGRRIVGLDPLFQLAQGSNTMDDITT